MSEGLPVSVGFRNGVGPVSVQHHIKLVSGCLIHIKEVW